MPSLGTSPSCPHRRLCPALLHCGFGYPNPRAWARVEPSLSPEPPRPASSPRRCYYAVIEALSRHDLATGGLTTPPHCVKNIGRELGRRKEGGECKEKPRRVHLHPGPEPDHRQRASPSRHHRTCQGGEEDQGSAQRLSASPGSLLPPGGGASTSQHSRCRHASPLRRLDPPLLRPAPNRTQPRRPDPAPPHRIPPGRRHPGPACQAQWAHRRPRAQVPESERDK